MSKKVTGRKAKEMQFKKLVTKANKVLDKLGDRKYILDDDFGATFHDKTIVTNKGQFRSNASKLNVKELNQRIGMLQSLIDDKDEYFKEANLFTDFGDKMQSYIETNPKWSTDPRLKNVTGQDVADFMSYVQGVLGTNETPSDVMNVMRNRMAKGQTVEDLVSAFYTSYKNTQGSVWDTFITSFSDNNKYL